MYSNLYTVGKGHYATNYYISQFIRRVRLKSYHQIILPHLAPCYWLNHAL